MKNVHVAVMDYSSGSIKMYTIQRRDNWETDDIESWLVSNTDYRRDQCYFMCSEE